MTRRSSDRTTLGLPSWQGLILLGCMSATGVRLYGQTPLLIENYEFATSDASAAAGVIDLTDPANDPAFYISGDCDGLPSPCDSASEGQYSLGTDAAFCQQWCEAGSRIGFRRFVDEVRFPSACPQTHHYAAVQYTYGDPDHPGPVAPDFPLTDLRILCDAYGDGSFADGPTGTHFWVNLVDCEGEIFEFINHSEAALNSELWTFDLVMGQTIVRLSPDSIVGGQPIGDGLLTEIAATETFIQDADDPPTSFGKWYIDHLRIREPAGSSAIPAVSEWGLFTLTLFVAIIGSLVFAPPPSARRTPRTSG